MIGTILSFAIDGYAAIDHATDRRLLLIAAAKRCEAYAQAGQKRQLLVIRHPDQMRRRSRLAKMLDDSCVVFVDCALEMCDSEADLIACYREVVRVAGPTEQANNIFVLRLQQWATGRTTLDPRVRWLITKAPPSDGAAFEYRPYGKRSSILADTRVAIREANQRRREARV